MDRSTDNSSGIIAFEWHDLPWCVELRMGPKDAVAIELWPTALGREHPNKIPGSVAISATERGVIAMLACWSEWWSQEPQLAAAFAVCLMTDLCDRSLAWRQAMQEMEDKAREKADEAPR